MRRALLCLFIALALPAFAQADLGFIAGLPGVSVVGTDNGIATYKVERAADTFNAVLQGLRSRGWRITNVTDQETSRASIRTLQAIRDGRRVTVSITNADVGGTMVVRAGEGTDIGVVPGDFGTDRMVVNENDQTRTLAVKGAELMVAGNRNHLTVTGSAPLVTVNGNDNEVRIDATVARLVVNGNGNRVSWSTGTPAVVDNGKGNTAGPIR